ncbi:hypothetical protein [Dietzia sp. PP-33]|uniref:hypothetical protein n=1 Tax=Dietzia sp. PP-33 TaxID=2957500 RepID=UPI0029AEDAD1|nr:hypothetical protein [Dietzia sp. PP-33]MDX2357527.1 hypothetical protein [Dietzia sp. PP-33]
MEIHLEGLGLSLAVLLPGLLLPLVPPRDPIPHVVAPGPVRWAERAGQASCLAVPALAASGTVVWWWGVLVSGALGGYYALWVRYLVTGRRAASLYWWRCIPVPMAVLPVVVFLATAGWLDSAWIAAAAVVLAVGHIPVSWTTARAVRESV